MTFAEFYRRVDAVARGRFFTVAVEAVQHGRRFRRDDPPGLTWKGYVDGGTHVDSRDPEEVIAAIWRMARDAEGAPELPAELEEIGGVAL